MAAISFSGLASGIDSDALIKATSEATRKQRITPNQTKITSLTDTNTSLEDFEKKLAALQSASLKFASLNGGGLQKQGASSDETKVSVTAGNSAINSSYALTVSALAKNGTISLGPSAGTYTASTGTISAGTEQVIEIGTGATKETVTVPISAGVTTISQFVASFNDLSSKASASLINIGTTATPNYRIVINANSTGTADGSITVTTNAAGFAAPTASPATDAVFTIAGIGSITRPTNSVSDVIAGVTLDIKSTGSATVNIEDDVSASSALVQEMVTAWNDIVTFIKDKNQIVREENGEDVKNTFSSLATTRVDDNALVSLRGVLSSTRYTSGSQIKVFADLGIKTERDGTLSFNADTFKTAVSTESVSVTNLLSDFANQIATTGGIDGSGGTINQYIRFNGLLDTTVNSNKSLITSLNQRIADAEAAIAKTEQAMRQRFATLESTMSRLQNQQSQLTSALAGLGG